MDFQVISGTRAAAADIFTAEDTHDVQRGTYNNLGYEIANGEVTITWYYGDGKVNTSDAVLILKYAAGMIIAF